MLRGRLIATALVATLALASSATAGKPAWSTVPATPVVVPAGTAAEVCPGLSITLLPIATDASIAFQPQKNGSWVWRVGRSTTLITSSTGSSLLVDTAGPAKLVGRTPRDPSGEGLRLYRGAGRPVVDVCAALS